MDVSQLLTKKEHYRFLDWLAKAEGRDKFGKVVQFCARMLSGILLDLGNEELGGQLQKFWRAMLDARRMSWFGKTFVELRTVEATLENKSMPEEVRYAHAVARFSFGCRWAVENLMILYKIGALTGRKWQDLNKLAKRFWTVTVLAGLLTEVLKLRRIEQEERDEKKAATAKEKCYETLVCHVGDSLVPLAIGWDFQISDKWIGLFHMIAGLIQSRNLYPAQN